MVRVPGDIFAEPDDIDPDTLANLGPLAPMAGITDLPFRRAVAVHIGSCTMMVSGRAHARVSRFRS